MRSPDLSVRWSDLNVRWSDLSVRWPDVGSRSADVAFEIADLTFEIIQPDVVSRRRTRAALHERPWRRLHLVTNATRIEASHPVQFAGLFRGVSSDFNETLQAAVRSTGLSGGIT